jgi:hypothetical protein
MVVERTAALKSRHWSSAPVRSVGGEANPGLVLNDGADVVHPVRFTATAGSLPGLDRVAATLANFPCGMSKVIFPRMPVAFAEVSIRKSLALLGNEALLRCISGGHLHSLGQTPSHDGVTVSSMAQALRCGLDHGGAFGGEVAAEDPGAVEVCLGHHDNHVVLPRVC